MIKLSLLLFWWNRFSFSVGVHNFNSSAFITFNPKEEEQCHWLWDNPANEQVSWKFALCVFAKVISCEVLKGM